ncbi:MAG: hypothetical protein RL033_6463 [Pseudomonadota bacterium]
MPFLSKASVSCLLRRGCYASLLALACTVSNEKDGGTDGVFIPERNDEPSPESFALWAQPGENLLAALTVVEEHDATTVLAPRNTVLGLLLNEAGAYNSAALAYQPNNTPYRAKSMQCMTSVLPDAVEEVCNVLQDPELRLVFIDDTPNFAQHRVLGRKLLQCARDAGFERLVIESLEESGSALAQRGYVSRTQSGRFLREPQLAGLVADALRIGFIPVGLPHTEFCTDCPLNLALGADARAQATSLQDELASAGPEGKVLVWAALGQAYKEPWGRGQPYVNTLASYVFADTGIEPYSLVQLTVDSGTTWGPTAASGMYLASGPNNGSCAGSYSPGSGTGKPTHNGVVFHISPPPGAQGSDVDRWEWLHTSAEERMSVTPECSACTSESRLLVQAFPEGVDFADRVPVDQALCRSGSPCQLALPAGQYRLVVWSAEAQLTSQAVTLTAGVSTTVSMN